MRIRLTSEHTLEWAAKEMAYIFAHVMYYQKEVREKGGSIPRLNLAYWNGKADDFFKKVGLSKDENNKHETVTIEQ